MSEPSQVETKQQSPTKPIITSKVKEKDPRRVEAGRRLGAISKIAKERKANERLQRQKDEEELNEYRRRKRNQSLDSNDDMSESEKMDHTMLYLTAVGVLVAVGGLYFAYKSNKREDKIERVYSTIVDDEDVPTTSTTSVPQPNLRSF